MIHDLDLIPDVSTVDYHDLASIWSILRSFAPFPVENSVSSILGRIETQNFRRGSRQVGYYVSHELSASLKIHHKGSVTNF